MTGSCFVWIEDSRIERKLVFDRERGEGVVPHVLKKAKRDDESVGGSEGKREGSESRVGRQEERQELPCSR